MDDLVAKAKMLIRSPAAAVFNAFVQPDLITKFWLEKTTGPLRAGATVEWEFLVPGATERVSVTALDEPRHLAFTWLNGHLNVEIRLRELPGDLTVVSVEARGFEQGADAVAQVVNATEGFGIVLCDLKTWLESGRSANLVRDKAAVIQMERDA
jgi:uncharacterized protein YndB with AHSA1/START domain